MTLNSIKQIFNKVSLQHKKINEFYHGKSYDVGIRKDTNYPVVFFETPINIGYADDKKSKQYKFALNVLFKSEQDNLKQSFEQASDAENIGDAILSKIQNEYTSQFRINGINALTLDEFSDDYLAGARFELTVTILREYSIPSCYEDQFNSECTDC